MIDFNNVAFGRRPHDRTRIAALPTRRMAAAAPPPVDLPRPGILARPSLVMNDRLPTCTVAGLLNHLRAWVQQTHGFDVGEDDQLLLDLYAAVCGCDATPDAIALTDGLMLIDVLEHIQRNGFRFDSQNVVELTFDPIDVRDMNAVRSAVQTDCGAYLGITLYENDVRPGLTAWGGPVPPGARVVGGHCVVPKGWTGPTFETATWGEVMPTDEDFLLARLDEAFSIRWKMATT